MMIRKITNGFPKILLKHWLVWLLLLLCVLGLITLFSYLWDYSDLYFSIVPALPVPTETINVQYLDSGSFEGYRTIQFETDQSAEIIRQFYRTELPKHGWILLCSPTHLEQSGCPLGLSPMVELADAYKRYDDPSHERVINVSIYKPGENLEKSQNRLVEVVEYRYLLPAP